MLLFFHCCYIRSVNWSTGLIKNKLKEAQLVPLEKLILSELGKEFLASYLTPTFITAFTAACQWTLSYPDGPSSKHDTVFLSCQIECLWIFKCFAHIPERHVKRPQGTLWWNITTPRLWRTDHPEWRFTWFSSIPPGTGQYNVQFYSTTQPSSQSLLVLLSLCFYTIILLLFFIISAFLYNTSVDSSLIFLD